MSECCRGIESKREYRTCLVEDKLGTLLLRQNVIRQMSSLTSVTTIKMALLLSSSYPCGKAIKLIILSAVLVALSLVIFMAGASHLIIKPLQFNAPDAPISANVRSFI